MLIYICVMVTETRRNEKLNDVGREREQNIEGERTLEKFSNNNVILEIFPSESLYVKIFARK